jgi:hypothetical protein
LLERRGEVGMLSMFNIQHRKMRVSPRVRKYDRKCCIFSPASQDHDFKISAPPLITAPPLKKLLLKILNRSHKKETKKVSARPEPKRTQSELTSHAQTTP